MHEPVWTIVVAAGAGQRFGGAKQFATVGGRTVVEYSIAAARTVSSGVVVVVPPGYSEPVEGADAAVVGGLTRSASVRAGLAAVPDDAAIVLVHDAARPAADAALFARVVAAVEAGADAAVPVVGVVDTLRSIRGGVVDRDAVRAVQTPQGFRARALRAAHAGGGEATDDAALVESDGGLVVLVDGDRANLKVTEPDDLVAIERVLAGDSGPASVGLRIGNGFDIHRFSDDPTRPLVLGGVQVPGEVGLVGHSDADVIAHACAEALLGATGLGDLGTHYADNDPRWAGADSMALLADVVRMIAADGWMPVNIDCSVIAERPKLAPHRDEMQRRLSAVVGAPVTVKGRRAEGIGGLGRSEGIACLAAALVQTARTTT